jgi:tetratricopeptide (TPR) repeat protein
MQPAYRVDLAAAHRNLGILATQMNQTGLAEKHYSEAIDVLEELEPKLPPTPAYLRDLIINHNNLATLLTTLGRPEAALKNRRRVVELETRLVQAFPKVADFRGDLARSLHDLAEQLFENEEEAEGVHCARDAAQRQEELIKLKPTDVAAQQVLVSYRLSYMAMLVQTGSYVEAAAQASDTAKLRREEHRAAALLSRCLTLAQKDEELPEARRQQLAQAYGDRAMELLQQARSGGFKNQGYLNSNRDFDAIRSRADFQALVRELTAAAQSMPKPKQR